MDRHQGKAEAKMGGRVGKPSLPHISIVSVPLLGQPCVGFVRCTLTFGCVTGRNVADAFPILGAWRRMAFNGVGGWERSPAARPRSARYFTLDAVADCPRLQGDGEARVVCICDEELYYKSVVLGCRRTLHRRWEQG